MEKNIRLSTVVDVIEKGYEGQAAEASIGGRIVQVQLDMQTMLETAGLSQMELAVAQHMVKLSRLYNSLARAKKRKIGQHRIDDLNRAIADHKESVAMIVGPEIRVDVVKASKDLADRCLR